MIISMAVVTMRCSTAGSSTSRLMATTASSRPCMRSIASSRARSCSSIRPQLRAQAHVQVGQVRLP
ncbi:hypothetical protein AB0929_04135 [Streptomyces massasporeus]|uniref:hypothetical protein n=1 Tax=Streptomyces massasporeus TaxID=67324 RepID=UPI0034537867